MDNPGLRLSNRIASGYSVDISDEENSDVEYDEHVNCSAKPILDIWEPGSLLIDLQSLPGAGDIEELIKASNEEKLLLHPQAQTTGLLFSAWMNDVKILKMLLDNKANPQITDNYGRTALHLAAYQGNLENIKVLLDAGATVNVWDNAETVTPLHCASSSGCVKCVRALIKAFADVNAGLSYRSSLHYAVQSNALDCAKELLEAGACPNTPQIFTETPLHVAVSFGFEDCARLLLQFGADVSMQFGPDKITPVHLAAEHENTACLELLLNAGASLEAKNNKQQTTLHLAALAQSPETLELLLKRGADPNASDNNGRTPLHCAIVKISRTYDCVKLLLAAGARVNKADIFGYTPLHIAALNEFGSVVMLLINYGGDITARTNGGISALSFILRKTPDVLPKYVAKLDSAIELTDHEIGDVDCELKLDFRMLVPCVGRGETELLLNFIKVGQKKILEHPLCKTFLFLKWRQIRKFFIFSLLIHTIFVLIFTVYIRAVFLKDCEANKFKNGTNMTRLPIEDNDYCWIDSHVNILRYILSFLNIIFLCKEMFQIAQNWKNYMSHWDNWPQWFVIICVFLCNSPSFTHDITQDFAWWQHHVAAVGIFFAWLQLMTIVGRFPIFGIYIQMFTTVALNFSKFLLTYSCLLIGFGLSFGVLFANYKAFKNVTSCLLKVVIMLSGELEYEDMFFRENFTYEGTAHILFFIFVLLVTIILNNLMVGLAVSNMQELQRGAGLDRLVRQTELMAHLESMLFFERLKCLPKRFLDIFHKQALLLTSHYNWELFIHPNDPREKKIPKELIRSIYEIVAERKDRSKMFRKLKNVRKNITSCSKCNSVISNSENVSCLGESNENIPKFKNKIL